MQQVPSIMAFYKREVQPKAEPPAAFPAKPGDGFTEEEVSDALDPWARRWNPEREYDECNISQLVPGSHAVTFVGRIVNLGTYFGQTPKRPKAAGFHSLIVKDDSGAIAIKLYFAKNPFPLKLGQLLSIWTDFISDASKLPGGTIPSVTVGANIFPGRATPDHVMIHTTSSTDGICHEPLDYKRGQPLPGLMTLDTWLNGGHDGVTGAKLLVCVKSVGARKTIKRKDGGETELADLLLFDHTGEVRLTLWKEMIESAKTWTPGNTILLISNPGFKVGYNGKGSVGVQFSTMVDVEPDFPDADWLKKYAMGLTKKESLCLEWPEGVWDADDAEKGVVRMLFTLAELDRWVRSDGNQTFTGFLNVTIMEMSLVSLHRRNMLMCAECCGVPIYSNTLQTPCRNCSKTLTLSLNPRITGTLFDETGCIASGKLLWNERAWEQLFGRSIEEITQMSAEQVRLFEERCSFLRCHLCVGWCEGVGRLAVIGIMM